MISAVYIVVTLLLAGIQAGYLRLARHFGLVDRPNERSSHTNLTTIRGGGILFFVAGLAAFIYADFAHPYFFAGLTVVAAVSFLDDLRPLPIRYRLGAHVVGVALLLAETGLIANEIWLVAGLIVVGVGILNAYNFMDGINGMTAFYGLVCVGTLWFWQGQLNLSGAGVLLPVVFIALLLFGWANARRRAICFAGDVGSVSIAFIILLPLTQIMSNTQTCLPILLLAVYGVDSVLTILHRLHHRENIFRAHRLHLFQLLVHRLNWPHLRVSALYALTQLSINVLVVNAVAWPVALQWLLAGGVLITLSGVYVMVKRRLMRPA